MILKANCVSRISITFIDDALSEGSSLVDKIVDIIAAPELEARELLVKIPEYARVGRLVYLIDTLIGGKRVG